MRLWLGPFLALLTASAKAPAAGPAPGPAALCASVLRNLTLFHASTQQLVYRCRPIDDCGGLADRMAGILSAAFLAGASGRAFRIQYPFLSEVLSSDAVNWTWSPGAATAADSVPIDGKAPNGRVGPHPGVPATAGLGLLSTMNAKEVPALADLAAYRVVYYHSNRGISGRWLALLGLAPLPSREMMALNSCVLRRLLRPTPAFLAQPVQRLHGPVAPLAALAAELRRNDTLGVAVHYRLGDHAARTLFQKADAKAKTRKPDPKLVFVTRTLVDCLAQLLRRHGHNASRHVLYVSSNSGQARRQFIEKLQRDGLFHEVWALQMEGLPHTNPQEWPKAPHLRAELMRNLRRTLFDAYTDWWMMTQAHVLVISRKSGYSSSAALVGRTGQRHYLRSDCSPHPDLCMWRFC